MMYFLLVLQRLFVQLIFILFITRASKEFDKFTFYYETNKYPLNKYNHNDSNDSNSVYVDIIIDNVIINILKTSEYPYIINLIENNEMMENKTSIDCVHVTQDIVNQTAHDDVDDDHHNDIDDNNSTIIEYSLKYDDYDDWNELIVYNTAERHRRRLRQCRHRGWRPFRYYHYYKWCPPIAPHVWSLVTYQYYTAY